MSVNKIQELVNSFHYWDSRVTHLNCNYFADEIELAYKCDEADILYRFVGCYKSLFNHVKAYDKVRPVKEMSISQTPYFLQGVEIGETEEEGVTFYTCRINMFPLDIDIWCKDIEVLKQNR